MCSSSLASNRLAPMTKGSREALASGNRDTSATNYPVHVETVTLSEPESTAQRHYVYNKKTSVTELDICKANMPINDNKTDLSSKNKLSHLTYSSTKLTMSNDSGGRDNISDLRTRQGSESSSNSDDDCNTVDDLITTDSTFNTNNKVTIPHKLKSLSLDNKNPLVLKRTPESLSKKYLLRHHQLIDEEPSHIIIKTGGSRDHVTNGLVVKVAPTSLAPLTVDTHHEQQTYPAIRPTSANKFRRMVMDCRSTQS